MRVVVRDSPNGLKTAIIIAKKGIWQGGWQREKVDGSKEYIPCETYALSVWVWFGGHVIGPSDSRQGYVMRHCRGKAHYDAQADGKSVSRRNECG
jgi:hypothetical protein